MATCLLNRGSIQGVIEFRECYLGPNHQLPPAEMTGEPLPVVYVNARNTVSLAEEQPARRLKESQDLDESHTRAMR